jgi:hypothetical protein
VNEVDSEDDERVPLAQIVGAARVFPLEAEWTPLDVLCSVKCIDENGQFTWAYRATQGINREELLGALRVHTALLERELVDEYLQPDD